MGHLAEQNRARRTRKPRCIWCRKELTKYTHDWWEAHDSGPMPVRGGKVEFGPCTYIVKQVLHTRGDSGSLRIRYWLGHWGYQGNGRFCSQRCGYHYALKSAGPWSEATVAGESAP